MSTVIDTAMIDPAMRQLAALAGRGVCPRTAAADAMLALAHLRRDGAGCAESITPAGSRALVAAVVGVLHDHTSATRRAPRTAGPASAPRTTNATAVAQGPIRAEVRRYLEAAQVLDDSCGFAVAA